MTTYAFIDGGYIRKEHEKVLKAIDIQGRIAYDRLVGPDVVRTFVYDCLDDIQKKGEDDAAFAQRVAADEGFFGQVENLPGFFMRWGTLTGLPRKGREPRQKRVDVQLAVDMMMHATRRNMDHAVLYSGDDDFVPLVRALVDAGTRVTVKGVEASTSATLRSSCDTFKPLGPLELAPATKSETHPVPTWAEGESGRRSFDPRHELRQGKMDSGLGSVVQYAFGGQTYLRLSWMAEIRGWISCMDEGPALRLAELTVGTPIEWENR